MRTPSLKKLVDALDHFNGQLDSNNPNAVDGLLNVLVGIDASALFFNDPYAGTAREKTGDTGKDNEILIAQDRILETLQKIEDFSKAAELLIKKLSDGSDISDEEAERAKELFTIVNNNFTRVTTLLKGFLYAKPSIKDAQIYDPLLKSISSHPEYLELEDVEWEKMSSVRMREVIKMLITAFEFEKAINLIEAYQTKQQETNSDVVNNILSIHNNSIKELIAVKRASIPEDEVFDERFTAANKLYEMYNMASSPEFESKDAKRLRFHDKVSVHAILDKDAAKSHEEDEYKKLDDKTSYFKAETVLRGDMSLGDEVEGFSSKHTNKKLDASYERLDAKKFWDEHLKKVEQHERKEPSKDLTLGKSSLKTSK